MGLPINIQGIVDSCAIVLLLISALLTLEAKKQAKNKNEEDQKNAAKSNWAKLILMIAWAVDTHMPGLKFFLEKHGAKLVSEPKKAFLNLAGFYVQYSDIDNSLEFLKR